MIRPTLLISSLLLTASACTSHAHDLLVLSPHLAPGATRVADLQTESRDADAEEPLTGLAPMVERLLQYSPTVQAQHERFRAAVEQVTVAQAIPDPMLSYAWLPLPVETRVGPNTHRIGLQQMIPFPTRIIARGDVAHAKAERSAILFDAAARDALTELKIAYADLYYFQRALVIVDQNTLLATTLSQLAANDDQNPNVVWAVARAQAQLAQLEYDRVTLTERLDVTRARINALLSRPADAPLTADPLPATHVDISRDDLLAQALTSQHELRALDTAIEAAKANQDLAHSRFAPDFMLGVQLSINDPSAADNPPADSGQDALAVTFGLTLPIYFHIYAAASDEADALLTAALLDKQAHLDRLPARIEDTLAQERNASRLHILYDEELLPHAIAALETAEQLAEADPTRFAELLEARSAYYSFALARERAVADHFQAIARLEQLIGATLTSFEPEGSAAPAQSAE